MCGITGFFDINQNKDAGTLASIITLMTNTIIHRGPDDFGYWVNADSGLGLGFRRLSIIDLSPAGHQPMSSHDDRFVIIFNGEIYNYLELRTQLSQLGHFFHGTSDTEVILESISEWGMLSAVSKFNGMFAFAIWDKKDNILSLVRDRIGIKPLYYGWIGKILMFGSELKSIKAHPEFSAEINRNALSTFLRYSYIPAPDTIYKNIQKLTPGTIIQFQVLDSKITEKKITYWSAKEAMIKGVTNQFQGDDIDAINLLDNMLTESISKRMIADVPLGAFLSGGIDSSTVVALMQKQSMQPIQTFTIGFKEQGFDEASHARAVSAHLGTFHTELYVGPEETRNVIPLLPSMFDEPFADPSQIPTYLVSALARKHVTVGLSGDGGDEFFGGYNRYFLVSQLWKKLHLIPLPMRKFASNRLEKIPPKYLTSLFNLALRNIPNPGDKIKKAIPLLRASSPEDLYIDLISQWKNPNNIVINGFESTTIENEPTLNMSSYSITERMMLRDQLSYLPDDILVKVDRASMIASLEVRAPFIDDHNTIEFSYKLPLHVKVKNGEGKWILKQLLNKYLPQKLTDRPKMGFGVPIDSWLRGPLRPWADDLLNENKLKQEGFFLSTIIQKKWQEHKAGSRDWKYELWNILMFEAWLNEAKS